MRVQAEVERRRPAFDPRRSGSALPGDDVPLSYAQHSGSGSSTARKRERRYHAQTAQRLTGRLDVDAAAACSSPPVVERHESLRTVVAEDNGTPYQVVLPASELELAETDLSGQAVRSANPRVRRLIAEDAGRPFDLQPD